MNRALILAVSLLLVFQNVTNAQSDICVQNSNLKREKFRLSFDTPNSSVLKKEELRLLLSENQFKTYNHARRCYVASIPLLSLSACCITAGSILLVAGLRNNWGGILLEASYAAFGEALVFLVSGAILITHSAKKLNQIAENYNNQPYTSHYQRNIQLNFGFTQNGIGLNLSF